MGLSETYKAARIIETIENIVSSDSFSIESHESSKDNHFVYDDEMFWDRILGNPAQFWERRFDLVRVTISDWVPRIPGLYWSRGANGFRNWAQEEEIAIRGNGWNEFYPPGKSGKVLGGIGTFVLPPDLHGYTMKSLTFSCNSSVGIPVLISPVMLNKFGMQQGMTFDLEQLIWRKLTGEWSQRFSSIAGIPKGCLVFDDLSRVYIVKDNTPVEFHPFTIMEYQKADALLYDFVYLTVDSTDVMYRERMMDFFEYYKGKDNRSGKYLLPVDMSNPLFDGTLYDTIDDLKRKDEYGNTQLSLISKRIRKVIVKGKNLEQLIGFVTRKYDSLGDIKAMCQHLGISTSSFTGAVPAKIVVQLIDKLIEEDRIEEMVDLVAIEHPEIINN